MGKKNRKKTKAKRKKTALIKTGIEQKEGLVRTVLNFLWEPVDLLSDIRKKHIGVLDVIRGVGLLYMLIYHSFVIIGSREVHTDTLWAVISNSMWFTNSMAHIHILIGIYVIYTQPSTRKLLLRGIQIFILGFLLNITRFLPAIIGVLTGSYNVEDFAPYNNIGDMIFHVDIYHYAGIAFFAFALLRKLTGTVIRPVYWLLMMIGVLAVTPFFVGLQTGVVYIDRFLDILWGFRGGMHIWFPFLPWFSYSLLGAMLGCLLLKARSLENMVRNFSLTAIPVFIMGVLLYYAFDQPIRGFLQLSAPLNTFGPDFFIRNIGVMMIMSSVIMWIHKLTPRNIILNTLYYWSNNIITFYCLHWIIIGWIAGIYFQSFRQQGTAEVLVVIAITLILTHLLTLYINRRAETKIKLPVQNHQNQ